MFGKMMNQPLLISQLIDHADRYHGGTEIVSVETAGGTTLTNWSEVATNARKLASALSSLGLKLGARCGTIAWNNRRHLEIYFGASGGGFVCHTLNPRLHPEQVVYVANDAEDEVLFFDRTFLPVVQQLTDKLKTVQHYVLLGPRDDEAAKAIDGLIFFDELIDTDIDNFTWPEFDENHPSSLCYTSGTTGNPKGVLYSHRSTMLHTLAGNHPDGLAVSAKDTVLPVVPMFHANAWGVPYIAACAGAKLILPGPGLDGESLVRLIDDHQVTLALGVPTIWMGLLGALEATGSKAESMTRTVVGGSALPPSMIPEFRDKYGVELIHAWGMTETSPLGTLNQLLQKHQHLPADQQAELRIGQGRPPFGVELRVIDEDGDLLPRDGETQGDLQIRGHWIVDTYFNKSDNALTDDGWFDTGVISVWRKAVFLVACNHLLFLEPNLKWAANLADFAKNRRVGRDFSIFTAGLGAVWCGGAPLQCAISPIPLTREAHKKGTLRCTAYSREQPLPTSTKRMLPTARRRKTSRILASFWLCMPTNWAWRSISPKCSEPTRYQPKKPIKK